MKRLFLTVVACFISIGVAAQVPVPYTFVPGTVASATQVNANFDVLAKNALNVANGVLTGNLTPDPGVTIDGIDLSDAFGGGTQNYTLTVDKAILIGPAPQITFGLDGVSTITITGDANGNATFEALKVAGQFYFVDPVNVPALTAISLQLGSLSCAGCVGTSQIQDGSVGAVDIADGAISAADIADGSIGAADIADGSVGAAELDNILGPKAGIYGDAVTVSRINVDADGRIIDAVNTPIAFPASYPVGPNTIPESAITDGALLARVGSPETITQLWTFNAGIVLNFPSDIRLYGAGEGGVIKQASSCPSFPGLWLGSREGGVDRLVLCLSDSLVTAYGNIKPAEDDRWTLGDEDQRFKTAFFQLPAVINGKPNMVITNKGGTDAHKNKSIAYFIGYPGATGDEANEVTKVMGACSVTIRAGLILNVTGC